MKLRATLFLASGSFGVAAVFAACSSFGSAPTATDASAPAEAASPIPDSSTPDGDDVEAGDAGQPDSAIADAAFDCRVIFADSFDQGPSPKWLASASGDAGEADFSRQTASFTLPQGANIYSVLASPSFADPSRMPPEPEPARVVVDFDVSVPTVDLTGVAIAQFPSLTPKDNVRIEANLRPIGPNTKAGTFLSLVSPGGDSAGEIPLDAGEAATLRWAYDRSGDEVVVTLERLATAGSRPLQLRATSLSATGGGKPYFQMGPFSRRGATTGAQIVYDKVTVSTCSLK